VSLLFCWSRCVARVAAEKGMSGMSGGGHPHEEIRLQVGPTSLYAAPAHPSGRVTRVGRLSLSVSVIDYPAS
jgi:hypothetical protein